MTASFWDLIVGIVLGIVTNFIAWAILFHYFIPKIRFSEQLSKVRIKKTREDRSGYRFRVKIENAGRRRIIDIELTARLSVKGLRTKSIWNTLYIPLSPNGDSSYRIPMLLPAIRRVSGRRKIIFLYPNSTDILRDWSIFPEEMREKARNKELLLEDLLKLGTEAKLEIHAYCYDSFSGTRKLFISEPYTVDVNGKIPEGQFDSTSLAVIPATVVSEESEVDEGDEY